SLLHVERKRLTMPEGLTWGNIILFAAFTFITFAQGILNTRVNAKRIENKSDEVKNDTVQAMNTIAQDTLADARDVRDIAMKAKDDVATEREARARLEGEVSQLSEQNKELRTRAEQAQVQAALTQKSLDELKTNYLSVSSDMDEMRQRMTKLEEERDILAKERDRLVKDLNEKDDAYTELMESVQARIDKAVSDVRIELTEDYEKRIATLEARIKEKDAEIAQLEKLLEETTPHDQATLTDVQPFDPDATYPIPDLAGTGAEPDPDPTDRNRDGLGRTDTGSNPTDDATNDPNQPNDTGTSSDT
ncbi:MAG: hypothetical protein AAFN11_13515, partial [Chloroflexota bacterium]